MKIDPKERRMNEPDDAAKNYPWPVRTGVGVMLLLLLVVAGAIALVVSTTLGDSGKTAAVSPPSAPPLASVAPATAAADPGEPEGRIDFEPGSGALPANASEVLATVADAARAQAGKFVLISSFHDASGDAAQNAELAKRRAQTVRHALEANGVAPDHLVLDQPVVMTGGADAREARRVELRVR